MQARTVKLGEMLTTLIDRGGYSRNRGAILTTVGVSAAALSQYARDDTRPSFRKLVALADFFGVSLDYLVFGGPAQTTVDHGPLAQHVDRALAEVQTRANHHSALVTRIGRVLADRVNEVAREVAESPPAGREGFISDDETVRLERYGQRVHMLAVDPTAELIVPDGASGGGGSGQVVAANLLRGSEYRFLVPADGGSAGAVSSLRSQLIEQVGVDRVQHSCEFRATTMPVLCGAGFYQLDVPALALQEPALHAQFSDYISSEGWFGYVKRTNSGSRSDMVMSCAHATAARVPFDTLWATAQPR